MEHKVICTLNLAAALYVCVASVLVAVHDGIEWQLVLFSLAGALWAVAAVRLFRTVRLWPWVWSVIVVFVGLLSGGVGVIRGIRMMQSAAHGDSTVHLDPSAVGMPFIGSCLLTIGAAVLLLGLFGLRRGGLEMARPTNSVEATADSRSDA